MESIGTKPWSWAWIGRWGDEGYRSQACLSCARSFPSLVMPTRSSGPERSPHPESPGPPEDFTEGPSFLASLLTLPLPLFPLLRESPAPPARALEIGVAQPVPSQRAMGVVLSPLPGAPSPCPASVPLTQRGSRDFPLLRALQGRQPWGLLFSMARPLPLLQHCPFPGTLRSERTEMSIWGEAGNRAGPGGQSQSLLEQQRPLGKRNSPGGREGGGRCQPGSPSSASSC